MREPGRTRDSLRDGMNLRLDNRQIVSFVIGSLVLLGVVFALGVLVGKQLASGTAQAIAAASKPSDPLAAIDAKEKSRTANSVIGTGELPAAAAANPPAASPANPPETLTFQNELTKPTPSNPLIEPVKPAAAVKKENEKKESDKDKPKASKEPKKESSGAASSKVADKADGANKKEDHAAKTEKHAKEKTEAANATKASEADAKHKDRDNRAGLAAAFDKASSKTPASEGYALQVASLPSREEADKTVARLSAKGYEPSIVEADVPNKGRVFRVRVGTYATRAQAEAALKQFKKKSTLSALIIATK